MYTYEQALQESIQYFNHDELAARVFVDKYALRDGDNNLLEKTPDDMHRRLAKEFARIEAGKFKNPLTEEEIYNLLYRSQCIIPQGSPIFGIGNKEQIVSLSNCFVVESPSDSYGGICKTDQELAQISKRRGGVGIDISTLRPKFSKTKNSSKTSTGTKTWMSRYSNTIREVGQDGRRGALMLSISVHHPDVMTFITAKNNDKDVTGANISVRLTDEFLNALDKNEDYELRFPVNAIKPDISKKIKANEVWNAIVHNAWDRAEPGILFWDNIIKESPADCYWSDGYNTISTNPCAELPLCAEDSCRLLSISLMNFVKNPFTKQATFDSGRFYEVAQIAQRLLDDLIDLELECIERIIAKIQDDPEADDIKRVELALWRRIQQKCINGRRTGLGATAVGDCIAALGLKYGSDASIDMMEYIYKVLKFGSYRSSCDMAKELGAFPIWDYEKEKDNPFLNRIKEESITIYHDNCPCGICDNCENVISGEELYNDIKQYGRRNIANLMNAPTGSISTQVQYEINKVWYTGTSSGIEPVYSTSFTRSKKGNHTDTNFRVDFTDQNGDTWMEFKVYHKGVQAWMDVNNKTEMDESCPYVGGSAEEIDWEQRVKLQSRVQRHIDHSISSTVNLPQTATESDIDKIYRAAWKCGCKGITVYRDKCRTGVLNKEERNATKDRPKTLKCDVHHITSKGHSYFVLIGFLDNKPYEVFAGKNGFLDKDIKTGTITRKSKKVYKAVFDDEDKTELCPITSTCSDHEETITRLTSALLRSDADLELIVEQLEKVHGDITIFAKCIARVLKKYLKDGTVSGQTCTECGSSNIVRQEGCLTCKECGYGKCG